MCLGSLDVHKIKRIKSILTASMNDLVNNHRDILCKNPKCDFTRQRDFTAMKTISTLIRFESTNSESELINILNCEKSARNTPTTPAKTPISVNKSVNPATKQIARTKTFCFLPVFPAK